jgi:hypothetical protein
VSAWLTFRPPTIETPSGWAQFASFANAEAERQSSEQRRCRCHHDRAEARHRRVKDRVAAVHAFLTFGLQREVDHHDGVLLDDANQQNDTDERDDCEGNAEDEERYFKASSWRQPSRYPRDCLLKF